MVEFGLKKWHSALWRRKGKKWLPQHTNSGRSWWVFVCWCQRNHHLVSSLANRSSNLITLMNSLLHLGFFVWSERVLSFLQLRSFEWNVAFFLKDYCFVWSRVRMALMRLLNRIHGIQITSRQKKEREKLLSSSYLSPILCTTEGRQNIV